MYIVETVAKQLCCSGATFKPFRPVSVQLFDWALRCHEHLTQFVSDQMVHKAWSEVSYMFCSAWLLLPQPTKTILSSCFIPKRWLQNAGRASKCYRQIGNHIYSSGLFKRGPVRSGISRTPRFRIDKLIIDEFRFSLFRIVHSLTPVTARLNQPPLSHWEHWQVQSILSRKTHKIKENVPNHHLSIQIAVAAKVCLMLGWLTNANSFAYLCFQHLRDNQLLPGLA